MSVNQKHSELEIKVDASKVDLDEFLAWCKDKSPIDQIHVASPDDMWRHKKNVIRHRYSPTEEKQELTVKKRKSDTSIMDRVEIDLFFSQETTVDDVKAFLKASGWKKVFTLMKEAYIFFYPEVSVVWYSAYKKGKPKKKRYFLEVEISKDSKLTKTQSMLLLEAWRVDIASKFKIGKPLNSSLFELFSKTKYLKTKG